MISNQEEAEIYEKLVDSDKRRNILRLKLSFLAILLVFAISKTARHYVPEYSDTLIILIGLPVVILAWAYPAKKYG